MERAKRLLSNNHQTRIEIEAFHGSCLPVCVCARVYVAVAVRVSMCVCLCARVRVCADYLICSSCVHLCVFVSACVCQSVERGRRGGAGLPWARFQTYTHMHMCTTNTRAYAHTHTCTGGKDFSETLTRAKFEELNIDLFKGTIDPVKKVLQVRGREACARRDDGTRCRSTPPRICSTHTHRPGCT